MLVFMDHGICVSDSSLFLYSVIKTYKAFLQHSQALFPANYGLQCGSQNDHVCSVSLKGYHSCETAILEKPLCLQQKEFQGKDLYYVHTTFLFYSLS